MPCQVTQCAIFYRSIKGSWTLRTSVKYRNIYALLSSHFLVLNWKLHRKLKLRRHTALIQPNKVANILLLVCPFLWCVRMLQPGFDCNVRLAFNNRNLYTIHLQMCSMLVFNDSFVENSHSAKSTCPFDMRQALL